MRMCACVFDCVFDCECRSALSFSAASQTCDLIETHRGVLRPSTGHLCTLSLPFKVVQPPFFPHTHTHTHSLSLSLSHSLSFAAVGCCFFFFSVWCLDVGQSLSLFVCVWCDLVVGRVNFDRCLEPIPLYVDADTSEKGNGPLSLHHFFFFLALLPPLVLLTCVVGKGWRLATSLAATCASSEKSP